MAKAEDIHKIINTLKPKAVEPSAYSVVLQQPGPQGISYYLFTTVAYGLEEAIMKTRNEMANRNIPNADQYIFFTSDKKSLASLIKEASGIEIEIVKTKPSEKNRIMSEIIKTASMDLYNMNKEKFSEEEKKLILDKLNGIHTTPASDNRIKPGQD